MGSDYYRHGYLLLAVTGTRQIKVERLRPKHISVRSSNLVQEPIWTVSAPHFIRKGICLPWLGLVAGRTYYVPGTAQHLIMLLPLPTSRGRRLDDNPTRARDSQDTVSTSL